jgi:hypothetical protein
VKGQEGIEEEPELSFYIGLSLFFGGIDGAVHPYGIGVIFEPTEPPILPADLMYCTYLSPPQEALQVPCPFTHTISLTSLYMVSLYCWGLNGLIPDQYTLVGILCQEVPDRVFIHEHPDGWPGIPAPRDRLSDPVVGLLWNRIEIRQFGCGCVQPSHCWLALLVEGDPEDLWLAVAF